MSTPTTVAVIGAGAAGLACAWLLSRGGYAVHLYDARDTAGGHAHTVDVPIPGTPAATIPVDAGFIVYNTRTYPDLVSLFELLGVQEDNSSMSFAASVPLPSTGRLFEWGSDSLASLFAQRDNLYHPAMYTMLYDMRRFNAAVHDFVRELDTDLAFADRDQSLADFLEAGSYSAVFTRCYLIPMVAAVWSASFSAAMAFPARTLFQFFVNHGLAQVFARPQWRTPARRSRDYVDKVISDIREHSGVVLLGTPVRSVLRGEGGVTVFADDTGARNFDHVVFATHAPTTLQLLGDDATDDEKAVLSTFKYSRNRIVIHHDEKLMPVNKSVWSAWNFIGGTGARVQREEGEGSATDEGGALPDDEQPVCVSYWLNKLQNFHKHSLPVPDLFLTLNPVVEIDPTKILRELTFDHPQFTEEAVKAQPLVQDLIQSRRNTWFCGAYVRYGFHEDAMKTGFDVAERLSGYKVIRPWKSKNQLAINDNSQRYDLPYSPLRSPMLIFLGALLVLNAVAARLRQGLGKIAARMGETDPVVVVAVGDGRLHRFGPRRSRKKKRSLQLVTSDSDDDQPPRRHPQAARITLRNPKVLARIAEALRQSHELAPIAAAAFAASEYDCPSPDDLTVALKALFIADGLDLEPSIARKGRAKLAESLLYAIVGGFKKIKGLPTHSRLSELTTCISSVVYPSWWLELDDGNGNPIRRNEGAQTVSVVSPADLTPLTKLLELLGDLSETTVAILQRNKECRATIVVMTPERGVFVDRKAELLDVKQQVDVALIQDFLKRWNVGVSKRSHAEPEETSYDLIFSPALVNVYRGIGFNSLDEAILFVGGLGVPGAIVEFGSTVFGLNGMNEARKAAQSSGSMFCGDDGFSLCYTGTLVTTAEKHGFELERISFMDHNEATMDIYEVIQRVYNSLATEKLHADETRTVLAQLCLWEAALNVKYIRRLAASFRIRRVPS